MKYILLIFCVLFIFCDKLSAEEIIIECDKQYVFEFRCAASTPIPTLSPTISPTPTLTPTPVPTPEPLPIAYLAAKQKWKENLQTAGAKWCLDSTVGDAGAWYYDGAHVYKQAKNLIGGTSWNSCIIKQHDRYKAVIDPAGGQVPGYRVFPHGLEKQNDTARIKLLVEKSVYSNLSYCFHEWSIHYNGMSREGAYMLQLLIIADRLGIQSPHFIPDIGNVDACEKLGNNHRITAKDALVFVKNHARQFVEGPERVQVFMAALTVNALIQYYEEVEPQQEILNKVKAVADWIWANAWYEAESRFRYCVNRNGTLCLTNDDSTSANLNLLIAPMYSWLYSKGQGDHYADKFDKIFIGGVNQAAIMWNGKIFSQNYRASFDSVRWREQ